MLIALARNAPGARTAHEEYALAGRPVVPAPVIAQAWRSCARVARLARALADCAVICCYTEQDYKRIGDIIGSATLPKKKERCGPDPVDGLVALTAVQIGATAVATSDPGDIAAYLATIAGGDKVAVDHV